MTTHSSGENEGISLDLGFTVGLGMPFDAAIEWAAYEGFEFVELLLDGPYARERITDRCESMHPTLVNAGLDIIVHLPFAVDPGSPFTSVREGAIAELTAGMDLAADLGAEKVVFYPSSDVWDLGGLGRSAVSVSMQGSTVALDN